MGKTLLLVVVLTFAEYHGGGPDGNDVAVVHVNAGSVGQNVVEEEGAGVRWCIAKDKPCPLAVCSRFNGDDAMGCIDAGVNGFEGGIGFGAFDMTAHYVFAFVKGNLLLQMEGIFYDDQTAINLSLFFLFGICRGFGTGDAQAKLFMAFGTFKDQRAAGFVTTVIEEDGLIAFGTANLFHIVRYISGRDDFGEYKSNRVFCLCRANTPAGASCFVVRL